MSLTKKNLHKKEKMNKTKKEREKNKCQKFFNTHDTFEDKFEKTDNDKNIIKLKTIYQMFTTSNYFNNLTKIHKRQNNYKHFIEKIQNNLFLKKYLIICITI